MALEEKDGEGKGVLLNHNHKSKSTFWQFLYVLLKWKWFLAASFVGIMIVVTILILLVPREYKAEASVLPPKSSSLLSGLSGISSVLQNVSPLLSKAGLSPTADVYTYLAILSSRTVIDSVISKFDLVKVYRITGYPMFNAEKTLRENTNFEIDENNAIDITVMDRSPVRAAAMANYFVHLLNEIYIKVSIEEAHNNKIFIEKRYEKNLVDLRNAEDTLQAFEQHYKIYDMPQQAKAAITAGADLQAQRMAAEVELGVLKRQFGEDAPQVRLKAMQIEELNSQMEDLQTGKGDGMNKGISVLPAFKNVPALGMAYLRLFRDYEIQTKLLEFILPLYEQAKIEEQKDTPAVIVLDSAVPPEKPSTPNRVFLELIFALVVGPLLVYFVHVLERVRNEREELNPLELRLRKIANKTARRFRVKEEIPEG